MRRRILKVLMTSLILTILSTGYLDAEWIPDGVPVVPPEAGIPDNAQCTTDGVGGMIITWEDQRTEYDMGDIYAQRIDASGTVIWTANGVVICSYIGLENKQGNPQIISDGAGGAIIAWEDGRRSWQYSRDIYAQRVDASGTVLWTTNGVVICDAANVKRDIRITTDGAGGAIIAWKDERSSNDDIYVQRIDAAGAVQWAEDGVYVCTQADGYQIIYDGDGGAIIVWEDAQSADEDIYAHWVDATGAVRWAGSGVAICTETGNQILYDIISDDDGGALVTWEDWRSSNADVYAQRIDTTGTVHWTTNGVAICTEIGYQHFPQITSDGTGGAIIAWYDNRGTDVYAQRVDASGAVQWTENGVVISIEPGSQLTPQITTDGTGGAIITWVNEGNTYEGIYAQRIDASGTSQWTDYGVAICTEGNDAELLEELRIISDDAGNALIMWEDYRSGNAEIYAQRIDVSGTIQWATFGMAICSYTGDHSESQLCTDGAGGAIVAWKETRDGNDEIYAQRIDGNGTFPWGGGGRALYRYSDGQQNPQITTDGAGGAVVIWEDSTGGAWNLRAKPITANGIITYFDGYVCNETGDQIGPDIVSDGSGGAIATWEDYRSGTGDIYAQLIGEHPYYNWWEVKWTVNGEAICTAAGNQGNPQITTDGAQGAIITWIDNRSGTSDIYACRIDQAGTVHWTTDGVAICEAADNQDTPQIISDGSGGAIITWEDNRSGDWDIYAQRIDTDGSVSWTTNGVAICTAADNQSKPQITTDGAGGAIITWEDNRDANSNIYAQWVDVNGALQWTANGIAVSSEAQDQNIPHITTHGDG
ncbi:MAG: hypothetical protein JSV33_15705 [bacterium]|nr:MAG: hypothetical protein JSV33_15705 [bacterium]